MGLSPAVVSKRVSLLEDRLGARLFQRTTRHLTLTETGEGYFKRVIDILSLVEEAEDFVSRRNSKPRGLLKVTVPTSFGRLHVAPHLPRFLDKYPEIEIDMTVSDAMVDLIREGFDLAVRIGELEDSSLVARKLAAERRVICAAPSYLQRHGVPKSLEDLELHSCLSAGAQEYWKLEDETGRQVQLRVKGNVRTNSAEFVREAMVAGLGIGLRSTWEVGQELSSGALQIVLPGYRGSSNLAIYAVYPSRDFMPAKVNVLIEYLSELYGVEPYWERGFGQTKVAEDEPAEQAANAQRRPRKKATG